MCPALCSKKWSLLNLNKNTPVDLRIVETPEGGLGDLDNKFDNPMNVSNTLIMNFVGLNVQAKDAEGKVIVLKDAVMI